MSRRITLIAAILKNADIISIFEFGIPDAVDTYFGFILTASHAFLNVSLKVCFGIPNPVDPLLLLAASMVLAPFGWVHEGWDLY